MAKGTGVDDAARWLWEAARRAAGRVDREVTAALLLSACHLLGGPSADERDRRQDALPDALLAAQAVSDALRHRRPADVDELLRIAWALAELDAVVPGARDARDGVWWSRRELR